MKTLFFVLIIFSYNLVFAQEVTTKQINETEKIGERKRNILFLELAGNGGFLSFNYERIITQNLSIRVGLGNDLFTGTFYPLMINYNFESPLEIGLGIVPFNFGRLSRIAEDIFADKTEGVLLTSLIGYKQTFKWFLFKASFTPFFNPINSKILLYGGLSFGYAF